MNIDEKHQALSEILDELTKNLKISRNKIYDLYISERPALLDFLSYIEDRLDDARDILKQ